jgi:hypothetical protein
MKGLKYVLETKKKKTISGLGSGCLGRAFFLGF